MRGQLLKSVVVLSLAVFVLSSGAAHSGAGSGEAEYKVNIDEPPTGNNNDQDGAEEYGEEWEFEFICVPGDNGCPQVDSSGSAGYFEVCGKGFTVAGMEAAGSDTDPHHYGTKIYKIVPNDLTCGYGSYNWEWRASSSTGSETLKTGDMFVKSEKSSGYDSGDFMYIGMNTDPTPNKLFYFALSDTNWEAGGADNSGSIKVTQMNPGAAAGPDGAFQRVGDPVNVPKDQKRGKLVLKAFSGANLYDLYQIDDNSGGCSSTEACDIWGVSLTKDTGTGTAPNFKYPYSSDSRLDQNVEDDLVPTHLTGRYYPEGEIIAAYPRKGNGGGDRKFYICRSDSGKVVNTHKNEHGSQVLFKCVNRDWEKVEECSDGVDNDNDGSIDHPDSPYSNSVTPSDTDCGSPSNNNEAVPGDDGGSTGTSGGEDCKPVIVKEDSGIIRAQYGGGKMSDSEACAGGTSDTQTRLGDSGIDDKATETFTCDDTNIDRAFCSTSNRTYGSHDEDPSASGSQISAVKYHPDDRYINALLQEGENSVDDLSGFNKEMMNRFVDHTGWKPAKMAVDAGYYGVESESLYGSGSPHDENYWFDTKGMVDGDGNGYSSSSAEDSWMVDNAGAAGSDNINDPTFPGGFGGKCPEGQVWKVRSRKPVKWGCSGQPSWKQAVHLPDITYTGDHAEIGMIVMPYNWKPAFRSQSSSDMKTERDSLKNFETSINSWEGEFEQHHPSTASYMSKDYSLSSIEAACWPNQNGFIPDFSDSSKQGETYFNATVSLPPGDSKKPLAIYGNLTMKSNSSYRCEWKYNLAGDFSSVSEVNDPVKDAGNIIAVHEQSQFSSSEPLNLLEYYLDGKSDESFNGYSGFKETYGYGGFGDNAESNMNAHEATS